MKVVAAISLYVAVTGAAVARDDVRGPVLVVPDFGLTLETPAGFTAEMVGQMLEGLVVITVSSDNPALPAFDPNGELCDISFQYDPVYGQEDQKCVNRLAAALEMRLQTSVQAVEPDLVFVPDLVRHKTATPDRTNDRGYLVWQPRAIANPYGGAMSSNPTKVAARCCVS